MPNHTGKELTASLSYVTEPGLAVRADSRWKARLPRYGAKSYPSVFAATDLREGTHQVRANLQVAAATVNTGLLKVSVTRPQVLVIPGRMQLTIRVTSPFRQRMLTGRVSASNPDRFLQDITSGEFRVKPGEVGNVVIPLPGAAPAEGETYDFTITVESYQGYKERRVHRLSFPPQADK